MFPFCATLIHITLIRKSSVQTQRNAIYRVINVTVLQLVTNIYNLCVVNDANHSKCVCVLYFKVLLHYYEASLFHLFSILFLLHHDWCQIPHFLSLFPLFACIRSNRNSSTGNYFDYFVCVCVCGKWIKLLQFSFTQFTFSIFIE